MLEFLAGLDRTLFVFINSTLANPVTDLLMPAITSDMLLRVLYGLAMALMLWKGKKEHRIMVVYSMIVLVISDQLCSSFLKPLFARPRPCHIMTELNLLIPCGGGLSMPSSHAANALAQAAFFAIRVPAIKVHLYTFASLVAVSRVFVGVHYPGDIIAGCALGLIIGIGVASISIRFHNRANTPQPKK